LEIILTYAYFSQLPLSERIDWIDSLSLIELTQLYNRSNIKNFLSEFFQKEENNYIRNKAVELISELTLENFIRYEFTKDFLIEDVEGSNDTFIICTKLKYLFLLFGDDREVYQELKNCSSFDNVEIAAEACYRIGLIHLIYRANQNNGAIIVHELEEARNWFIKSQNVVENRIDAVFFELVICYLLELLAQKIQSSQHFFEKLTSTLTKRQVWSWLPKTELLEFSIFRALTDIRLIASNITQEARWTDYKKEYSILSKYFNDLIAVDSLKSKFITTYEGFTKNAVSTVLDQYYLNNLSARKIKIQALLNSIDTSEIELVHFLSNLKERLEMLDEKKVM